MFNIFRDIFPLLLITACVSGACVNVPNQDMVEYACENGYVNDLYTIPERTEKIRISNMKLPRITRETFSRFGDNVLILMCTHCGIEEIEPDSFKALTNLQQLRLDNNHLRTIRASWFESLKQLTYLDLNYNEIETIEDGVFDSTPELIDLRISGNKLQCLNVDELSRLGSLTRIFVAKNPELKCPNALSKVLEEKQLTFEKDPEWSQLAEDIVSPPVSPMRPTTPRYRERLISTGAPDPTVNYQTAAPNYPPSASYPNYEITTEASHRTSVPWYTPPSYTSEPSYPTRNWPSPTEARSEVSQTRAPYNEPYYPPQEPRSSTQDPNPYTDDTSYPTGPTSDITWTGGSDDTFSETDYPPMPPMPPSPETSRPPAREEAIFQTSKPVSSDPKQTNEAQRPPRPLENYQQVEEKAPVAVNLPNSSPATTAKPKPSSSTHSAASAGLLLLTIFYSLVRTF